MSESNTEAKHDAEQRDHDLRPLRRHRAARKPDPHDMEADDMEADDMEADDMEAQAKEVQRV